MRAVLICIQPKWCGLIASGKKTIEVRKSVPKLKRPFKVYIYCTIGNGAKGDYLVPSGVQCGKVIGEFVCDRIVPLDSYYFESADCIEMYDFLKETCLSWKQFNEYANGKEVLFGWHISNLVIYDRSKELSEFKHWINDKDYDGWNEQRTKIVKGFVLRPLTRPPQSWCRIEGL